MYSRGALQKAEHFSIAPLVGVDDSSNKRPGSVVVTRPTSHGEVPGSNPGLVVLFSLTPLFLCGVLAT